nr:integrase, catalytic region, zinc finger, CCHC-type, peptidase aspartic, catalytic [Tanacetum cinerariifolium]
MIASNETAKDLWDALERQMCGSEYGEQDKKAAILYEYETFKAIEGEQLLDTYLRYLQVINDLKKCGYKKENCESNYKFLNNLQQEWKQYATLMRQTKNLIDINIDALYNILNQNQGDVNDALGYKKKAVMVTSDPLALVVEKINVSKRKEKVVVSLDSEGSGADDFSELKKITALLEKDFNRRKFYSKTTNNNLRTSSTSHSANKKQEFVKSDDKKVKKKDDEKKRDMSKVKCYNCKKEGHFAKYCKKANVKDYNYYKTKMLLAKKYKSEESSSSAKETIAEVAYYTSESESESEFETLEYYDNSTNYGLFVNNDVKHVVINTHVECREKYAKLEEERYEYIIRYSALFDNDKQHIKQIADQEVLFDKMSVELVELDKYQTSSLKQYVSNVILEKIIIDLEDEVVSLLEKEKENLKTIESLKSNGFESSENAISESENQSENNCLEVEKECDKVENLKVIAPGLFKLNLDTFSSVRGPNNSGVIWKKKGSSNVDLSAVSLSKLNKNVKRYSCKDLLSCNSSHLGETSSASVCNDTMNVSCNFRMCDLLDDNNFFIFDDESVKISPVSKMPFRKKPCDSMIVRSKSKLNKSLPRTVHKWFSKLQLLAELVAKWFPRIVQIYLWIIDSGCSKHMTGNRALLTNFVEMFLGTVRFGNNDFAVIAGYGYVAIRSMKIKKVYYVEGLGHNLFSVGQFYDKGLEVAFRKSTCFVRNEDGVDLLGDRSSNLYTIALNEVASNSSTCHLAKASSLQSWL